MGRPTGLAKTGGRRKGTLNKRTQELLTLASRHNYNPFEKLMERYQGLPAVEQIRIDFKILELMYPRVKDNAAEIEEQEQQDRLEELSAQQRAEKYEEIMKGIYASKRSLPKHLAMIKDVAAEDLIKFVKENFPDLYLK